MIISISFMESWLKFQAPGMTLDIGVGIGQLVFDMLNKVEITLALAISILWWIGRGSWKKSTGSKAFIVAVVVLILQTVIFLPIMDSRAELCMSGAPLPPSNMHIYYVAREILKVIGLTIFGINRI